METVAAGFRRDLGGEGNARDRGRWTAAQLLQALERRPELDPRRRQLAIEGAGLDPPRTGLRGGLLHLGAGGAGDAGDEHHVVEDEPLRPRDVVPAAEAAAAQVERSPRGRPEGARQAADHVVEGEPCRPREPRAGGAADCAVAVRSSSAG